VHGYFDLWVWDGTLERIHEALYLALREKEGREARRWSAASVAVSRRSFGGARTGAVEGRFALHPSRSPPNPRSVVANLL